MSSKKKIALCFVALVWVLLNVAIIFHHSPMTGTYNLYMTVESEKDAKLQLFHGVADSFDDTRVSAAKYEQAGKEQEIQLQLSSDTNYLRLDLGDQPASWKISDAYFEFEGTRQPVDVSIWSADQAVKSQQIASAEMDGDVLLVETDGSDPFLAGKSTPDQLASTLEASIQKSDRIKDIIYAVLFNIVCLIAFRFRKKFAMLPVELFQNRTLIMHLAKNDFKTKYAGSYLGIVWAFIQPIVTVLVYWFVFQVGLRSGGVGDFPFVLWLIAGLVPWFFFQDTLNAGTNALLEYNYLVKKVVFKISILPIVKAISALFVHLFFVAFTLVMFACYGHLPDLYTLQVVYYSFCMFLLVLGLCYATSAIVIFFRDLTQIINIILQVGVWMTPIMWKISIIPSNLVWIFKLNPMYYIVSGYRDALINKVWFWENFDQTVYFWGFTAVVFVVGTVIFKRLKVHFADVL